MDDLARIRSFARWYEDTVAERRTSWRFGTVLFDDRFPGKWDANFLRVERSVASATAAELAAEADRLQSHLRHREFVFEDDAEGARVAAGFVERGYDADRLVTMALHRDPDRSQPGLRAEEVDLETVRPVLVATNLAYEGGMTREDAEMLVDYRRVIIERVGARFFAGWIDDEIAGCCEVYVHDGVAQIEDVVTDERFRNRGVARAFLGAAIAAGRDAGADLTFLTADDDDWPKLLYTKLGFDPVDRFRQFTKPPERPHV
jgi:ribosomal protein S18 acetylase RimI-like enzyme